MRATVSLLLVAFASTGAAAQMAPSRQANQGTWAELEERQWVDDVRSAIHLPAGAASERVVGQFLADCMVASSPQEADAVVRRMMPTAEVLKRYPRLLRRRCNDSGPLADADAPAEVPSPLLQMLLADALVKRKHRQAWTGELSVAAVQDQPVLAKNPEWVILRKLGGCIASRNPEAVRQLAQTTAASNEEKAAMALVGAELGECLPPGATLKLKTADVRGAALLAFYLMASNGNQTDRKVN